MTDKKDEPEGEAFTFPLDSGTMELEQPRWGERISLGHVLGEENFVHRPLNAAALNQAGQWAVVAVLLGERVKTLEERLALLEDKLE